MKTKRFTVLAIGLILSLTAFAQPIEKKWGFEFNSGASFATNKLADAQLKPGFGFEGLLHYRFMANLGIYGGWGWNKFTTDNSFAGSNTDFEETGYVFGLQYTRPLGNSSHSWFLRGGGLYNHIELENSAGDIIHDSGHGLGWQAAGGLEINLNAKWCLTPMVKFHSLSRNIEFEGSSKNMDLNYFSFRVGIARNF